NTMEATLTEIWQEVLGLKKVGVKDNFFDLGGNSLKILSLVQCLTKKMGVSIDFQTVFYAPTVELMAMQLQLIRSNLTNLKKKNTFIQLNKYGKINIFCFPPPPGIGLVYMEMAKLLESECVVNVTDFIDHFENYEAMLYEYVKEISSIQNEGPYVLCGYSGGGNLAFEVAKTMEQSGMSVSDIIMIDTTPWNKEVHMISTQLMHDIAKENDLKYSKRKYLDYMDQLTNLGKVSANLHNIVVETVTTRYKKKWRDYTWKVYKEYNGYGKHDELLHPVYVKENIKIIKRIVDEIVNSKMESDVY
ncbi:thioesterase domain-containing protein, partial [uncultured Paenibacillus sp.]|uniref:thioesterase domain-containing protein n=1 Tax=uncultured Paenibacillus sp. TaxID=227322 RepID=UPI0025F4748A